MNETVKKCYKPMVQMCDGEPAGSSKFDPEDPDVICKTVFESECTTRYRFKERKIHFDFLSCSNNSQMRWRFSFQGEAKREIRRRDGVHEAADRVVRHQRVQSGGGRGGVP